MTPFHDLANHPLALPVLFLILPGLVYYTGGCASLAVFFMLAISILGPIAKILSDN